MLNPKNDPFFEQLKADIQEAIDEADRGESISAEEVWAELHQRVEEGRLSAPMHQPKGDPFFEQLKADVQEGIDELNRGEAIDEDAVWAHVYATIDEVERKQRG